MQDHEKTQDQLIEELRESRLRVAEFEAAEMRLLSTEMALEESEELFHGLFQKHSPVMLLIEPMTGQILDVNNAAERFYGYTMSQLRSMSIQDINILGPDEVAHERILALQEKKNHFIFPHRLANGEVRTVEMHSTPIERGEKTLLFSIIQDITERKQVEEELRESRETLELALNGARMGMWQLHVPTMTGKVDQRAAKILSFHETDISSNSYEWDKMTHPDDLPKLQESLSAHLEGRVPVFETEHRMRKSSGEWVWVHGRGTIMKRNEDGTPLLVYGTILDITYRKRAEAALRESEERFRVASQSVTDVVWEWDLATGGLKWFGDIDRLLGYDPGEFPRTIEAWDELIDPDDHNRVMTALDRHIKEGYQYDEEYRVRRKDGGISYWQDRGTAIRDMEGKEVRMVGAVSDITKRKRADEELRRYREHLEELVQERTTDLERANEELSLLLESLPVIVVSMNAAEDLPVTYMSQNVVDVTGYSAEDFTSNPHMWTERLHPDDLPKTYGVYAGLIKEGYYENEFLWQISDGSYANIYVRLRLVKSTAGTYDSVVGTIIDVTHRKLLEQALRKSEHRWRTLIETMNEGVVLLDSNATITYANDKITEMLGYSREEMIGKLGLDFVHEVNREILNEKFTKRKTLESISESYEITLIGRDGRSVPVISSAKAIFGESDQFQGSVITYVDISQYMQAMEALRESEEKYKALIETTDTGYLILDSMGKVTDANREYLRLSGHMTLDQIIGRSVVEWTAEHHRERNAAEVTKCLQQGYVRGLEIDYVDKKGQITPVEINGTVVKIGQSFQIVALCRDITARKKVEEELKRARDHLEARVEERTTTLLKANEKLAMEIAERERAELELKESHQRLQLALTVTSRLRVQAEAASAAKTEFLTIMSHELRTPLTAIIGFSELLYDQSFGKLNDKQSAYAREIFEAGHLLLQLINDILDLAKVESGKMDLQISSVDLGQLLQDCLIMIGESAAKRRHSLDLRISDDLEGVEILADEVKLKQIVVNLLTNAVKFTPSAGRICLECEVKGDNLLISVSDTGIGINPEDQKCIFDVFQQLDSTFSRQEQGTGLGLALVYRLVELHGGHVWVESEGNGKGSTFRFTIPFIQAKKGKEDEAHRLEGARIPFARPLQELPDQDEEQPRVLVVEDNEANMRFIATLLQMGGYAILQAVSAEEGIRIAESESPALILMDISLFDMDGLTAARILKANPATSDIPLIALTAHAMNEDKPRARQAGCDAYLTKPVNTMTFFRTVADLIKARKVKAFQKQDS